MVAAAKQTAPPAAKSAQERAAAYRVGRQDQAGRVKGGAPGWVHYWFVAREKGELGMDASRIHDIRADLFARGYEACNGPERQGKDLPVHVPGANGAEVWRLPQAIADDNFIERKKQNDSAMAEARRRNT